MVGGVPEQDEPDDAHDGEEKGVRWSVGSIRVCGWSVGVWSGRCVEYNEMGGVPKQDEPDDAYDPAGVPMGKNVGPRGWIVNALHRAYGAALL